MKSKNRFINFFLVVVLFNSCSKDETEYENPILDFSITTTDTVAPSNITTINNTTNYSGDYSWKIIKPPFSEEIITSSENLEFEANRLGTYEITLIVGDESITKSIEITQPSSLYYNKITLLNIGNNYESLYFRIKQNNYPEASYYIYTSPLRNNVTSTSVNNSDEYWNLSIPISINISEEITPLHVFEFYDENNNLVSTTEAISGYHDSIYGIFKNEDEILVTSSFGCGDCDYIEISVNTRYRNY